MVYTSERSRAPWWRRALAAAPRLAINLIRTLGLIVVAALLAATVLAGAFVHEVFFLGSFLISFIIFVAAAYSHRRSEARDTARLRHPSQRAVGRVPAIVFPIPVQVDRTTARDAQ